MAVAATIASAMASTPSSNVDEALIILDSKRRIKSVSQGAAAILGRPGTGVVGLPLGDVIQDLSGVSLREIPFQGKSGRNQFYLVTLLVEHESDVYEKWIQPWQGSQELAVIRTAEGKVLAANEAFARKFGVPRKSWPGQDTATLVHPEDLPSWRLSLARLSLNPYRGSHEHRWQTAQGWRWLSWEDSAVRDDDGLIVAFRSVGRDVTKRRLAEEHFQKLASAIEQSPFAIVMTLPDGRVQYTNPKFTSTTGFTLEDIFEKQIDVLRIGHPSEESYENFRRTVARGERWSGELCSRRRDGSSFWEFVHVSPIRNFADEVTHLLCVREDINDRKSLEDQLRQAQKMESLGTLAGGIAHDFNNILAIINGFAEIGLVRCAPSDPNTKSLKEIHNAAQRAIGLVRQILTFSRKTESSFRAVNVNQQLKDLGRMCSETFPRTVRFVYELDEKVPEFFADPNQLQQVIMNLCVNARDAMTAGGRITVGTRRVAGPELRRLGADETRDYVCISVSDTGCGMPPEVRARIFEPFFTTKQNSGGTGLGLAVVYGIVLSHKGLMDVQTAEGQGTTFYVYLPLEAIQPASVTQDPAESGKPFPRGTETVLVVDDERGLRDLLKTVMEPAGYRMLFAADGAEAVNVLLSEPGEIDAVLLDLNLPQLFGVDVYRHIRATRPEAKVIVVSGNLTTEVRRELVAMGQDDFIAKPYHLSELGRRLRKRLDLA